MKQVLAVVLIATFGSIPSGFGQDKTKEDVAETVRKGLEWLARQQRNDGSFEVAGGQNPTAMTGIAGMAFLLEGSTIKDGKYSQQIKKATEWYMKRSQPNGLLANPANPMEASRYMYGLALLHI